MTAPDAGASQPASALAEVFVRRLSALEAGELRDRAAARALAATPPEDAAALVAALAHATGAEERAAMAAVARALGEPRGDLPYAWLAALYAAATERGLAEVAALLVAPPPHRRFAEPRDRDARLSHLTLGHKKAMARAHRDPDLLARLAAEGDPVVVRELLRNPLLTEDHVVRIAARRPIRPGTLRCVFESRRWSSRPAVALAVARNPWVETELALKLVPVLGAAELADIARDGTVHPLVRAVAERLVAARTGRGPAGAR